MCKISEIGCENENGQNSKNETNENVEIKALFREIYEDHKQIKLPPSWNRENFSFGNKRGITFVTRLGRKGPTEDTIDSFCHKEVTLDENMLIVLKINGDFIEIVKTLCNIKCLHFIILLIILCTV